MPLLPRVNHTQDLRHWLIVMIVFGITGFSALVFSRLLFNVILGMEGSLWSGPWSYRVLYLSVIPPFYSAMLVLVGSIFGKRQYFMSRVLRMWSSPSSRQDTQVACADHLQSSRSSQLRQPSPRPVMEAARQSGSSELRGQIESTAPAFGH